MSEVDERAEEISTCLRPTGSGDSLYVLDLSRRQSRTREREVCELEQMIESSQVDSLRKRDSDNLPPFSATIKDPLVGNIEMANLGVKTKGFHQRGQVKPDTFSATEEDQVLASLEETAMNQAPFKQDRSSLFSLKAKTELKVLSRHVYQLFLVSNSVTMTKVEVTEQIAKKILPPDTEISDVIVAHLDILLSTTSERSIQGP